MGSKIENLRETTNFEILETFSVDKFGKVLVLENGTFKVGWKNPSTKRIVWHSHNDVWLVLKQNERVIQKFAGFQVDPVSVELQEPPINQGVVLSSVSAELAKLTIPGEITKASNMAQDLSRLAFLTQRNNCSAIEIAALINKIQNKLGPRPKSALKIEALERITQGLNSDTVSSLRFNSLIASENLFARAQEGVSIVRALFVRAAIILRWIDDQERKLSFWQNVASEIMYNFGVKESLRQKSHTGQLFSKTDDELYNLTNFVGNPFKKLGDKSEIKQLRNLKYLVLAGQSEESVRIAQLAYPILYNNLEERKRRESTGHYEKYRLPSNLLG